MEGGVKAIDQLDVERTGRRGLNWTRIAAQEAASWHVGGRRAPDG